MFRVSDAEDGTDLILNLIGAKQLYYNYLAIIIKDRLTHVAEGRVSDRQV